MKILYAANNSESSNIALRRFLEAVSDKNYTIKIAAYKKSSQYIKVDWTLDSLHNIFAPKEHRLDNENLQLYCEEVKRFNPDLIISDFEYYSSYIAHVLNIKHWQCSPILLNFALEHQSKYSSGLFKNYLSIFNKHDRLIQNIIALMNNSDKKFVYSHFGDMNDPPKIKEGFEWIRPYFKIGKKSALCEHNLVARLMNNDKGIIHSIKKYKDVVLFSNFMDESYDNVNIKPSEFEDEYYCNLANSNLLISTGQTNLLADAFYNKKYAMVYPDFNDAECLLNALYSEHFNVGKVLFNKEEDIEKYIGVSVLSDFKNIKFLHEKLEEV